MVSKQKLPRRLSTTSLVAVSYFRTPNIPFSGSGLSGSRGRNIIIPRAAKARKIPILSSSDAKEL